jgi:hypothetical protein
MSLSLFGCGQARKDLLKNQPAMPPEDTHIAVAQYYQRFT